VVTKLRDDDENNTAFASAGSSKSKWFGL